VTRHLSRLVAPAWGLAVGGMLSVQLGSALSVHVISAIGPGGTAWLRLTIGTLILWAIARPPLHEIRRRDLPVLLGLGVTTGVQTITFLAAIERIPLGTSVAIEFLGPLTVAAVRSHSRRALAWPALALWASSCSPSPGKATSISAASATPSLPPQAGPPTSC